MDDPEYVDDGGIPDGAILWRRIPPWHIADSAGKRPIRKEDGTPRASSAAFENDPDEAPMSTYVLEAGLTIGQVLAGHEGYGIASLTAGELRNLGQKLVRDPVKDFPQHVLVVGRKTKSISQRMSKLAKWVVDPLA